MVALTPAQKTLLTQRLASSDDMAYHMPTLMKLASKWPVVTEFGVRRANSTIAMLATGASVVSYDIEMPPQHDEILKAWPNWIFHKKSSLEAGEIGSLVFIDSLHNCDHISHELKLVAHAWCIAFHDVMSCGIDGQSAACKPPDMKGKGILPAIFNFMADHPFHVHTFDASHSGLLVIKRDIPLG